MVLMNKKLMGGKTDVVRLDCDEVLDITYSVFCAYCHKEIIFTEEEFYKIALEGGYSGAWYCNETCLDRANGKQTGFKLYKPNEIKI